MTLSVHPRLRGELFARKGDEIGYTGSSPLTRGTRAAHRIKNRFHRFIPAYAGNSAGKVLRRRSLTVHPRLRGELRGKKFKDDSIIGSSPLTRGTLNDNGELVITSRFIPAYAGNSLKSMPGMLDLAVHPRLRGELLFILMLAFSYSRFIPAYAGNSLGLLLLCALSVLVHPRLRGEL